MSFWHTPNGLGDARRLALVLHPALRNNGRIVDIPGVVAADIRLQTGETAVTIADNKIGLKVLYETIQEVGYYPSSLN